MCCDCQYCIFWVFLVCIYRYLYWAVCSILYTEMAHQNEHYYYYYYYYDVGTATGGVQPRRMEDPAGDCPTCLHLSQVSLCLPNEEEGGDGETAKRGVLPQSDGDAARDLAVPHVSTCPTRLYLSQVSPRPSQ